MDRKQKIELLKGIATGSRSIEETMPQSVVVRYLSYNISEDAYHEYLTGEIIPGKVYREKHKRLLKNPGRPGLDPGFPGRAAPWTVRAGPAKTGFGPSGCEGCPSSND